MVVDVEEAPAIAPALLKEKLHNRQKAVSPSWPAFNRLMERHDGMVAVYRETASGSLSRQQLRMLPEQIIHAGSSGTDARFAKLRDDDQSL